MRDSNLKKINEILAYFNFDIVAKVMEALDWHWEVDGHIPDEPEMRLHASNLLFQLAKYDESSKHKENRYISSGGFRASLEYVRNIPFYSLSFVAEEFENTPELEVEI